jgi:hypothetical protein
MLTNELKYLTRKEVCETSHIALPTQWKWSRCERVISFHVGKRVLFKPADLEAAMTKVEPINLH